jgi:hypothetical protein
MKIMIPAAIPNNRRMIIIINKANIPPSIPGVIGALNIGVVVVWFPDVLGTVLIKLLHIVPVYPTLQVQVPFPTLVSLQAAVPVLSHGQA